jgi:hypothetical protein
MDPSFLNDPYTVIVDHLRHTSPPPSRGAVQAAGAIIRTSYQEFGGQRNAFGVCVDLADRITESATVLAEMFATSSDDLPERWRANPAIARTVLSMAGYIELGYLKAHQVSVAHEGGHPSIDTRITVVKGLIAALQAK